MSDPINTPSEPAAAPPPPPAQPAPVVAKRSGWRKALIVIAVLFVLGAIGGIIVWRATQGAADAANAFLHTTATSGPAAARAMASPAFQQNTPEPAWESFAQQAGLTTFKSASWNNRQISNNVAHLEGSITTAAGATVPLVIELVKAGDKWQVQLVRAPDSGVRSDASGIPPSTTPLNTAPIGTNSGLANSPGISASNPAGGMGTQAPSSGAPSTSGGMAPVPSAAPTPGPMTSWNSGPSGSAGGPLVPGAQVAGVCMNKLQEQAGIRFDSIECLNPLPAQQGATTQCSISKGALKGQMLVTVTGVDRTSGRVDFHCTPGNPM